MKHKIRRIVTAALLSMAIMVMSVSALSASAATESVNECKHYDRTITSAETTYPSVTPQNHKVTITTSYECNDCPYNWVESVTQTEPHRQEAPGSPYCVCRYYLYKTFMNGGCY